jgi:hypothetical protein
MDLYCFDFHGAYLGYMRTNGDFFDGKGRRWAELVGGSEVYDLEGRYRGHVDAQGSLFDQHGACWGYVRGWTDAADLLDGTRSTLAHQHLDPVSAPQPEFHAHHA